MNMHIVKPAPTETTSLIDPTFAAIARHRAANDAFSEFLHRKSEFDESRRDSQGKFKDVLECAEWDEKEERFLDVEQSAADDLAATVPTTLEGVFAKMDYVSAEHLRGNRFYEGDDLITVISSVLDSGLLPGKRTRASKRRSAAGSDATTKAPAIFPADLYRMLDEMEDDITSIIDFTKLLLEVTEGTEVANVPAIYRLLGIIEDHARSVDRRWDETRLAAAQLAKA